MADKVTCTRCKGTGYLNALVSAHGDEKEEITCNACNGRGFTYVMTDDEESDYHADYW